MLSIEVVNELRDLNAAYPDLVVNVYSIFLEGMDQSLLEIEQSIAEQNSENLARKSHHLKSSCFSVGAQRAGELCQELELFERRNVFSSAESSLRLLSTEFDSLRPEIRQIINASAE